jgi:hypothetical protein
MARNKKHDNPWGSPKRQRSPQDASNVVNISSNDEEEQATPQQPQQPTHESPLFPPTATETTTTTPTPTPTPTTTTPTPTTPTPTTEEQEHSPPPKQPRQETRTTPTTTRIFNLYANIRRCIKDTNILDAPSQFAVPFGSLKQADEGHHHVVAYDTYDFATDLNSLLNAAPAWLNRALKRCSTPPVVIVRAQYGLSTIILIKNLPPTVMFAIQPSWTSRIIWKEATPSFGPPTKDVTLQLEKTYRVMGVKETVLKATTSQRRTLTQMSQYNGLLRGVVALSDQHKAAFMALGVLVMDNDSLVKSTDSHKMIVIDFEREATSDSIIKFLAKLQANMGAQASLTNFRGRVKLQATVDVNAINKVSELGKGVVKFVRQQQQQQYSRNSPDNDDNILPQEKPTPELLLLTGTTGILLIEHVHAILKHIQPQAATSAVKAHNGRTALLRITPELVTQFDGTTFNKTILAVAFEKVLIQRDIEKEELRRSIERHGQSTGPTTTNINSDSTNTAGAPPQNV